MSFEVLLESKMILLKIKSLQAIKGLAIPSFVPLSNMKLKALPKLIKLA